VPNPGGLDFGAVLQSSSASSVYAYALDIGGLNARLDTDGVSVLLTDPAATPPAGSTGPVVVAKVDAPGLVDANGDATTGGNISVALVRRGDTTLPAGVAAATVAGLGTNEVLLVYSISKAWLSDPSRAYPVTLDPCIGNSSGCTGGYIDTYIMSAKPTNYVVNRTFSRVGTDSRGTGFGVVRELMYFPDVTLGAFNADAAQVTSATMSVHQIRNYGNGSSVLQANRITAPWTTQADWAGMNNSYDSSQQGTTTVCAGYGTSESCTDSIDVTAIVRDWYSRLGAGWKQNLGFMLLLSPESAGEVDFDLGTGSVPPVLTITTVTPGVSINFDASLGPNYVPSTMAKGQTVQLPVSFTNTGSFTLDTTYKAGYRWFDPKGNVVAVGSTTQALPGAGTLAPGASTGTFLLPVTTPSAHGQYTLRLDLVHVVNGVNLWSSDWAWPSLYYARDKRTYDPSNTRWVGGSVIERDEFPINVLDSGGTALGPVKSVTLGDGSTASINLWSQTLHVDGSGGVGFTDLLPVNLGYQYDSGFTAECTEILQACGWSTNFDERVTADPSNAGAYTYQDPSGNHYLVGTDANGQLIMGAPVSLQRLRYTIADDNTLPWSGTAPVYDTANPASGAFSTRISGVTTTTATFAPAVAITNYHVVNFSARESSTSAQAGIVFQVLDPNTGVSRWFGYTFGSGWIIPGISWQLNVSGSSTGWSQYSRSLWNDIQSGLDVFPTGVGATDAFSVTAVMLVGNTAGANAWFDGIYLSPGGGVSLHDTLPTFTNGGSSASLDTTDPAALGTAASVKVLPTGVASSPTVGNAYTGTAPSPFAVWYWRKVGGTSIAEVVTVQDVTRNQSFAVTYYAGSNQGYDSAIQVSAALPTDWTRVTRDAVDDARQLHALYNDHAPDPSGETPSTPAGAPTPDQVQITGYQMVALDGQYALFDEESISSVSAMDPVVSAATEDYVATYSDGSQHMFNRDGLLTRIVDRNSHQTTLTWSYDTTKAGQAAYTLTTIHAASDGAALSGGTAVRELKVTYPANAVRFTEALGSTTSSTGRYTEFDRNASSDLTAVVPARLSAPCAAAGSPSGCSIFTYSSHQIQTIRDPRSVGTDNLYYSISWATGPYQITDMSVSQPMLVVDSLAASSPTYRRVLYQDAPARLANSAVYIDMTPDGSTLFEYAPKSCAANPCVYNTPSSYPAAPTTADLSAAYTFDGAGSFSTETRYRTAGGAQVVSRRGTNAALGIDNLNDPLSAAETAWDQTSDQYFASHAAGNDNLYRTFYTYNALHEVVDTTTPYTNPAPAYSASVLGTSGLAGYWRLGETSGSTAADSSSGGHPGTIGSGVTLGVGGALIGDSNKAMTFNGTSGEVTTAAPPTTGWDNFSLEAWFKVNALGSDTEMVAKNGDVSITCSGAGTGYGFGVAPNGHLMGLLECATWMDTGVSVSTGVWHYGALVRSNGVTTMYLDGVQAGSTTWSLAPRGPAVAMTIGGDGTYAPRLFNGSIDEVAVYSTALSPQVVQAHWNEGIATVTNDMRSVYDAAGNQTSSSDDTFLINPGFEFGNSGTNFGWTFGSSASISTASAHTGVASLALGPGSSSSGASQTVRLVPGQTFRFQTWVNTVSGGQLDTEIDDYYNGTWNVLATSGGASDTWSPEAMDLYIPAWSDGRIRVILWNGASGGTTYVDDIDLLTTLTQITYSNGSGGVANGLPTDRSVMDQNSFDAYVSTPLIDTHLTYATSPSLPAILPTASTADYVTGVFDPTKPDQDVISHTGYDAWGRTTSTTDADGVTATTTYATNMTDVATTADGLGNATHYNYDQVGNRTSVTSPLNEVTGTTYDLGSRPLKVTSPAPFSVVTSNSYTNGLLTQSTANYIDGVPSGPSGVDDVITTYGYDPLGNPNLTIVDNGTGLLQSETTAAYDLFGNVTSSTVYADSAHTQARTTAAFFDATGSSPTITRARPTGSQSPIAPTSGRLCPGSSTQYCDRVSVLDMAGEPVMTYDAYGVPTLHRFDLDGHEVRTVVNYSTGTYNAAYPDRDITTDTTFDLNGSAVYVSDVLGRSTYSERDALGRVRQVFRADGSWTRTDYTPAGRVSAVSRPGASGAGDSSVAWSHNLYDAAGRQTATLNNWDTTGGAQLQMSTFESGTAEGFTGSANWAVAAPASLTPTLGTAASGTANTGYGSLAVTTSSSTQNGGVSLALTGTFTAGHTYRAVVYAKGDTTGQSWRLLLGSGSSDSANATMTNSGTTSYSALAASWTPTSTHTSGVVVGFEGNYNQSGANTVHIDDVEVWDTGSASSNIPSLTVYDADGHPVASVLPGGNAGDPPMVTRTAFDTLGRTTDVTADAVAGAGTTAADKNLVTHSDYDALGRKIDVINPLGIATSYGYDRLGRTLSATANYISGQSSTASQNVTALAAYDATGEVLATCTADGVTAGCTAANITSSSLAWHYVYDPMGHEVRSVPPVNATLTALDETVAVYDSAATRVAATVSCPASAGANCSATTNADRHADMTHDALGRTLTNTIYSGTGTASPQLATSTVYDGAGQTLSIRSVPTTGSPNTVEFTYDTLGRVTAMYEGVNAPAPGDGNPQTEAMTYNADGTIATRTDFAISTTASAYTYDILGRLITATSPISSSVSAAFTWRLDGLMATRTFGTISAALVFAYDGAKRPIAECNGTAGACTSAQIDLERTYDRAGNVLTERQQFSSNAADPSQQGTQTFTYDALNRVLTSSLNSSQTYAVVKAYTYDSDGNRLTVKVGGVTTDTFSFDTTDQTKSDNSVSFAYDRYGNLTASTVGSVGSTTYAYDLADRLNTITQPDASMVGFTFDALGRHASRTGGTSQTMVTIDAYTYVGSSDTVDVDVSSSGVTTTINAAIDSAGDRLATCTNTGAFAWILPDLHGNVVAQFGKSSATIVDVFRYDAYGKTIGTQLPPSTVPSPWRFQGRILESTAGSATYDFAARAYVPDLGTFTSLDSVSGGVMNPLSLNRYLYANANPETLVDPDGHCAIAPDNEDEARWCGEHANTTYGQQTPFTPRKAITYKKPPTTSGGTGGYVGQDYYPAQDVQELKKSCSGRCMNGPYDVLPPGLVGVQPQHTVMNSHPTYTVDPDGNYHFSWTEVSVDAYADDSKVNLTGSISDLGKGAPEGVSANLPYGLYVEVDKNGASGQYDLPMNLGAVGGGVYLGMQAIPDTGESIPGADTRLSYAQSVSFKAAGQTMVAETTVTQHSVFVPGGQAYRDAAKVAFGVFLVSASVGVGAYLLGGLLGSGQVAQQLSGGK
jgi:RHS repeat-associated protein